MPLLNLHRLWYDDDDDDDDDDTDDDSYCDDDNADKNGKICKYNGKHMN